ncbi:MAG TPA: ATP-binding protein [Chitinophagaceae bacterium]|jgi:PAS domain S-box-containing protein|nr:ATP-binding protein [Chitinophagaceae bacterium]
MLKGNQIRIAVVDDDEDDYFIIKDYIQQIEDGNFVIDWLSTYQTAIDKIKAESYHIYFVDYRLGNETGLELLQEANNMQCDQPIVLLTGKGNKAIDIKAMQMGATDYLAKSDLNTEKLERCIRYSLDRAASLRELKERENKYRNLFKSSKDAVFISDKNLFFTECNQATSLLFGLSNGELLHHSLFEFVKEEFQKERLAHLLKSEENFREIEIQIRNQRDEIKLCLVSISFQKNAHPHHLIHGLIHDITNIKKAELANLQAQKLAANERLIRILAHEIRNPLNNITLAVEQLNVTNDDKNKQQYLIDIVQRNSTRINKIITELLDLTKPLELKFERHTLQEILDESLSLATDRINLQHIKVQKNYPSSPLEIDADKSKLIIAFTNLVINAIEAMETDKGELAVSISALPNAYSVSIRDNGKGIPEEYMPKLFEPFFTSKKNGTGLGLAACFSIIESHKGTIHVESKVDQGSNFIINFSK